MPKRFAGLSIAFAGMFGGFTLAGCSLPALIGDDFLSVAEVVEHVQCELRDARTDHPVLDNWVGAFSLNLNVLTNHGADASLDWVIPYRVNETFKLGPSLGTSTKIKRDGNMKFDIVFANLMHGRCTALSHTPGAYRLYGDFGIKDWISKILLRPGNEPKQFDYTVEFGVKLNTGIKPGFSIVRLTGAGNLSADRTDTHTLGAAFTVRPPQKKLETAQIVCVANLPSATPCNQAAIKRIMDEQDPTRSRKALIADDGTGGLDQRTREQLYQQLDILRLRDQLQR